LNFKFPHKTGKKLISIRNRGQLLYRLAGNSTAIVVMFIIQFNKAKQKSDKVHILDTISLTHIDVNNSQRAMMAQNKAIRL